MIEPFHKSAERCLAVARDSETPKEEAATGEASSSSDPCVSSDEGLSSLRSGRGRRSPSAAPARAGGSAPTPIGRGRRCIAAAEAAEEAACAAEATDS